MWFHQPKMSIIPRSPPAYYMTGGEQKKGQSFQTDLRAPPVARTLDPNIKSVVLYQLS